MIHCQDEIEAKRTRREKIKAGSRRRQHFRAEDGRDHNLGDPSQPRLLRKLALCLWVNRPLRVQIPHLEKRSNISIPCFTAPCRYCFFIV